MERNFEPAGAIKIYSLSGEFREFKSTKLRAHRCKIWLWWIRKYAEVGNK
jgi:hypothetical protein